MIFGGIEDLHPRDYFDYPQDYRRWQRGEPIIDAPLDVQMAEAKRQIERWRHTLDWLAER